MTDAALRSPRPASPLAWAMQAPPSFIFMVWVLFAAVNRIDWSGLAVAFGDTDDAMRLVEVRDFLAGQNWFDLHQYRLDPPSPVPMHWSRLVDAPIALIIAVARVAVSQAVAEKLAFIVWPPLTLLPVLFGCRALAVRLGGGLAALPAVLLMAWLMPATWQFSVGRIDHHNVQIALTVWLLVAFAAPGTAAAAAAGLLSALLLAVGLETLPFVLIVAAMMAVRFVLEPERGQEVRAYGLALAGATLSLYTLTVPIERYLVGACDALSLSYLAPAVLGGLGLALSAGRALLEGPRGRRLAALALTGGMAFAAFAWAEPACLRGPFGQIDPALHAIWLDMVQEIQPITVVFRTNPVDAVVNLCLPVLALGAAAWLVAGRAARDGAGVQVVLGLALCCAAALAIGCLQIRTLVYANVLAVPLAAGAIGLFGAHAERAGRSPLLAVVGSTFLASSLSAVLVANLFAGSAKAQDENAEAYRTACYSTATYAPLDAEPPGLVAAFIDNGPFLLAGTHHSVLSAPYHRMARGIRDGYDVFASAPEAARDILRRRGVAYVALCVSPAFVRHYGKELPNSLAARLERGDIPAWLEPIGGPGGPMLAFRVLL